MLAFKKRRRGLYSTRNTTYIFMSYYHPLSRRGYINPTVYIQQQGNIATAVCKIAIHICTDGNTVFRCDSDKNSLVIIYMF